MKQLVLVVLGAITMTACNNGNRDYTMDTNTGTDTTTSSTAPTTFDTSASGVQDTSTVIGYDTAARKP